MGLIEEDHKYSYSQLSSFDECPYGYYLERIEGNKQIENPFAQYGTLMHECIEDWAKNGSTNEELVDKWQSNYDAIVTEPWPPVLASKGYGEKSFQTGLEYLENFNGFGDNYEVIYAEKSYETKLENSIFRGIVDLVLRDKTDGGIVIVDHKSKSKSTFRKARDHMYRQLYLYSKFIYEEFGVFPKELKFNLFKEGIIDTQPFDMKTYEDTIDWARDIIFRIENYDVEDFLEMKDEDFFCDYICGMRKICLPER